MRQEVPAVIEDQPPHGADRVPTLTEVLEFDAPDGGAEAVVPAELPGPPPLDAALEAPADDGSAAVLAKAPVAEAPIAEAPIAEAPIAEAPIAEAVPPTIDTPALVAEVLAELQPRLDMRFEARLREALAPALARAADGLIREAREELGSALHGLVDDAVKRALQRRGLLR